MDAKLFHKLSDFGVGGMPLQEFLNICSSQWEKRVGDVADRGCGALDIEQNCLRASWFEWKRQANSVPAGPADNSVPNTLADSSYPRRFRCSAASIPKDPERGELHGFAVPGRDRTNGEFRAARG